MARSLRIELPGARYHVTSRGNGGQAVFLDDTDHYKDEIEACFEEDRQWEAEYDLRKAAYLSRLAAL